MNPVPPVTSIVIFADRGLFAAGKQYHPLAVSVATDCKLTGATIWFTVGLVRECIQSFSQLMVGQLESKCRGAAFSRRRGMCCATCRGQFIVPLALTVLAAALASS